MNKLLSIKEPLYKVSMDSDNNQSLVDSTFEIINFDRVKEAYTKKLAIGCAPKSCDGLYYDEWDDVWYMIEFKNGLINSEVKTQVYFKILESILMLADIIDEKTNDLRNKCIFILVYNDTKNRNKIGQHIKRRAGEELVRFGIERYEKIYLKTVHTLNPIDFENMYVKKWAKADRL